MAVSLHTTGCSSWRHVPFMNHLLKWTLPTFLVGNVTFKSSWFCQSRPSAFRLKAGSNPCPSPFERSSKGSKWCDPRQSHKACLLFRCRPRFCSFFSFKTSLWEPGTCRFLIRFSYTSSRWFISYGAFAVESPPKEKTRKGGWKVPQKKHLQYPKGQGFLYDEKVRQKWFVLTLPAWNFQKLDIQVASWIFFRNKKNLRETHRGLILKTYDGF